MFIGRKEELKFLGDCYQTEKGQLIVLYGRRRVGKTEVLRKFCEGKSHVFFSCLECPDVQQLEAFSERVLRTGIPASRYITRFPDWIQAFESIQELPGEGKKLMVIDEFPYMVNGNKAILSILQRLWDESLKDKNVMLILCGSAMSFIEKEVLAEKNPLYGRATGILKMREMDFLDAAEFVPGYSAADKITAYAILGGIPHYLKQFDDKITLAENVRRNILNRASALYNEVEFLLHQELRETGTYNVIINAVALGKTKLNDIFQKTQIEKTKLSVYLKNLMELGLIRREFSVSDGYKEQANVQRGLYQVEDHFFRFWYAFVFPNLSELEAGDAEGIWKYVISPRLDEYTSHVFEQVCREYMRRENRAEKLPFRFTKMGRYWDKETEIDIMAMDQDCGRMILGECKYRNSPISMTDVRHLWEKGIKMRGRQIDYWFFSKGGFTEEVKTLAGNREIFIRTAEEIASKKKIRG